MIEKRTATINLKRIKVDDIRAVAKIIYDIYLELLQNIKSGKKKGVIPKYTTVPRIGFKVETKDNAEYWSDSMDLFDKGGILDSKVIKRFSISMYYDYREASILLSVADSQFGSYTHSIEVEGTDSTWVNGIFNKLQETVNSWEKQGSIFKRFRWPISVLSGLLAGFTLGWICTLPLPKFEAGSENSGITLVVFTFVGWLSFFVVTFLLSDFLEKLWPNIEIVPAPEHERKLDRKRKYLYYIISAILIPFAIAVVANF